MSDIHRTIRDAWLAHQRRRPYRSDEEVLRAITPPGGEWEAKFPEGAITRQVVWNAIEVALVNPSGSLDDSTEGQIAMGLRATPVLDTALRVIHELSDNPDNLPLIARIAETAVAYIEASPPSAPDTDDDIEF